MPYGELLPELPDNDNTSETNMAEYLVFGGKKALTAHTSYTFRRNSLPMYGGKIQTNESLLHPSGSPKSTSFWPARKLLSSGNVCRMIYGVKPT